MTPREANRAGSAAALEAIRTGRVRDVVAEQRAAAEERDQCALHGPLRPCTLAEVRALRADVPHLTIVWAQISADGQRTVLTTEAA